MKKILTLLSFITALSSSIFVVSCKVDKTEQKINGKENKNDSNQKPKELEKPNGSLNPSEQDLPKDQPSTKKEKDEKTDSFADKLKKDLKKF
ncbi:hypothetical protein [Mycoplasma mycoides]|uniref:hypothetical protein n=1 Tax=Mycoplasma mycoides TaxID=2102 RepID=UPI00273606F1|nr:hypothetical protein [Mycoplasma mycoides]MDP4040068.1 hypothetical protein [Mycoplasma mycoides]MDP4040968.1 hypothetical protein [Mycoplasma mycoides]MDP4041829.1 hypothetical protein [Mycoplasma mycoides]MDP4043393.1 hypothetical protein [Mycoplasma mycoides]MDP4044260.1 hypothetical protein [Mycoplasma mycoides]